MRTIKMHQLLFLIFLAFHFAACSKQGNGEHAIDGSKYQITYSPDEVIQNSKVAFDPGQLADPGYSYEWDFGDGKSSAEMKPSHIYTETGRYPVILTVVNGRGAHINKTVQVEVLAEDTGDENGRPSLRSAMAKMGDHIWLCAHRGQCFENEEPENSLASLGKMIEQGIEMSEVDVRQTKDGKLILSHDASIDRMTNGSGKIADLTLSEIQRFKLKVDGQLTNEVMPELSNVLTLVKGKMYLDLDVKIDDYAKVYQVVKEHEMLSQVAFCVYDVAAAEDIIAKDSQLVLMPVVHDEDEYNSYVGNEDLNLALVQFNSSMYTGDAGSTFVDDAKTRGISFFGNCYMNDPRTPEGTDFSQIDRFIRLKGQIIQTDYAVTIKAYLKGRGLN